MENKELYDNSEEEFEEQGQQYIVVGVEKEMIAINIKYIESILLKKQITRVPDAQKYFKGVINLRGDIVPMMSLRLKMGFEDKEFDRKTRFVVLKLEENKLLGIITDEVREVINLSDDKIEQLNQKDTSKTRNFGLGIGKVGNDLITILDIKKLIEAQ